WSLDNCDDEKSRAAIEKMIMEEEYLLFNNMASCLSAVNLALLKKPTVVEESRPSHRKPWTKEEQDLFMEGLKLHGRSWTRIATMIPTRTVLQVKNYANQYFRNKVSKQEDTRTSRPSTATTDSQEQSHCVGIGMSLIDSGACVRIENTSDDEEEEDPTDDLSSQCPTGLSAMPISRADTQLNSIQSDQSKAQSLTITSATEINCADDHLTSTSCEQSDANHLALLSLSNDETLQCFDNEKINENISLNVDSHESTNLLTEKVETSTQKRERDNFGHGNSGGLGLHVYVILDVEKAANKEFFMGRSLKTPARYLKIRNYILDMWDRCKPSYLFKTSVRSGLRNCGDVNSIGRVHSFLEDAELINVGCPERPRPKIRHTSETEPDKVESPAPIESWVNFLRPRKRRIRHDEGNWVEDTDTEGFTIAHLNGNEGKEQHSYTTPRPAIATRKTKVPRTKSSYDPFKLVPYRNFPSSSAEPFHVALQSDALIVMDVHAHLSTTEVIGLLGGTYSRDNRVLQVLRATPCRSLSTSMQCEMDPVSQTQASEKLASKGMAVVGWYHSHPTFAPNPSVRDIETQAKFQEWFAKGGAAFIGVIVSPYNYVNTSNQSQIKCLTVSQECTTAEQQRVPFQFDYE
ncbi:predicted protein, partial [Nematostella vectensis]